MTSTIVVMEEEGGSGIFLGGCFLHLSFPFVLHLVESTVRYGLL